MTNAFPRPAAALWILPALLSVLAFLGADAPPASRPATKPAVAGPEIYTTFPFDAKEASRRQDQTAAALGIPKLLSIDLAPNVPMKLVLIPAGKFQGGWDGVLKELTVEKPFYMAQYKVSQVQYLKIMGKNPSIHTGPGNSIETAVDYIKWADANEFCKKASEKTGKKIALPSNLQWEYACRAGTRGRCYWGNDNAAIGDFCWWHDNCMPDDGSGPTHPGGKKKPNAFELYDMMGMLWEWTSDGGTSAIKHDARGGTYDSKEAIFRSSGKTTTEDAKVNDRWGMRVILELD